jgi:IS5 family transposase
MHWQRQAAQALRIRRQVSVATTLKRRKGGQFAIHAKALPGNPYDGHTLAKIIPAIEQLIGNEIERLHADAGYHGRP